MNYLLHHYTEGKLKKAVEDLAAERRRSGELEEEVARVREELVVARASVAAPQRSDLGPGPGPGMVAALEADVRRLNELLQRATDSLAHEKVGPGGLCLPRHRLHFK